MAQPPSKHSHPMPKHVDHSGTPYAGPLVVDATGAKSALLDVPPGATRGLHRTGPNLDKALTELAASMPSQGKAAGVPDDAYQTVLDVTAKLDVLAKITKDARKLYEVCNETQVVLEDERERALSRISGAVRQTAKKTRKPAIEAPFEKTIAYTSAAARKAVATRRDNKAKGKTAAAK